MESSRASASAAQPRSTVDVGSPEWATERWKLKVEAEARKRLKANIQDVGAER